MQFDWVGVSHGAMVKRDIHVCLTHLRSTTQRGEKQQEEKYISRTTTFSRIFCSVSHVPSFFFDWKIGQSFSRFSRLCGNPGEDCIFSVEIQYLMDARKIMTLLWSLPLLDWRRGSNLSKMVAILWTPLAAHPTGWRLCLDHLPICDSPVLTGSNSMCEPGCR